MVPPTETRTQSAAAPDPAYHGGQRRAAAARWQPDAEAVVTPRHNLSHKFIWIALGFLAVALAAIGFTLLETWKLEGEAAAINDMGSERMRSYRIAYLLAESLRDPQSRAALDEMLARESRRLEAVLDAVKRGDPARPLFLPRNPEIQSEVAAVEAAWRERIKPRIGEVLAAPRTGDALEQARRFRVEIDGFVRRIDGVVRAIELDNARNTAVLRSLQLGLMALAVAGTVALIYLMFLLVVRPVTRLEDGMRRMAQGDLGARVPVETRDEFGALGQGFNRMAEHLQNVHTTLEQRVADKTRSLLSREKELAVSEERRLLAQELHDSIAQSLAFLNLQAQLLQQSLARSASAETGEILAQIRTGIQECYDDVRELLVHFRTRIEDTDIESALRATLSRFESQTGIRASFRSRGAGVPVPPGSRAQVVHILQEALSNVRKHSAAGEVVMEMERGDVYRFQVRDDGRGFDPAGQVAEAGGHVGLSIMRERARRIGGDLRIVSRPGSGTEVSLALPVPQQEAA